jgi:hypothetical protein
MGAPGNDDITAVHDFGPHETGAEVPPDPVATPPAPGAPPAPGDPPLKGAGAAPPAAVSSPPPLSPLLQAVAGRTPSAATNHRSSRLIMISMASTDAPLPADR